MFRTAATILAAAFLGLNAEAMSTKALAQYSSNSSSDSEDPCDCNCKSSFSFDDSYTCDACGWVEDGPYCCKCY